MSLLIALLTIGALITAIHAYQAHVNNGADADEWQLPSPEESKDKAIEYIFENYPELASTPLPEAWTKELMSEPDTDLYRGSTAVFEGAGWTITVSSPRTITPIHEISVRYEGEAGFTWDDTVHEDGTVYERVISKAPTVIQEATAPQ
jgi:hypothetical protein